MNIILNDNSISISGVDSAGTFFEVSDNIGFSTRDEDMGFNTANTNFMEEGVPYPQLDEVAMVVYAYLNKPVKVLPASVAGQNIRPASVDPDYENSKFRFNIEFVGDGWYTIHAFLLNIDASEGIYLESSTGIVKDADTGESIPVDKLVDLTSIQTISINRLMTPYTEGVFTTMVGELCDLGMELGQTNKEYKKLQQDVLFVDGQLSGAYVKFEDGFKIEAQETIEHLLKTSPYVNRR